MQSTAGVPKLFEEQAALALARPHKQCRLDHEKKRLLVRFYAEIGGNLGKDKKKVLGEEDKKP